MNKEKIKQKTSLYLSKLHYKDSDFLNILKNYVTNMRLVALVLVFLIFAGTVSFFSIARTLNPEINLAIVTVTTVLPGATPSDVEALVTKKIEKEVKKVDNIDKITSTSRESVSVVVVQFNDGVESDAAQTDIQNAVGTVSDLPIDAKNSQVKAIDFKDIPILRYAVTANDIDGASLNSFVDSLVEDIEDKNLIDRVEVSGNETQEVQILISQEKLQELKVDLQTLSTLITTATSSFPAGTIRSEMSEIGLTIDRDSLTVDDLREIVISIDGILYRLGDIVEISERSEPGHVPAFITNADNTEYDAITLDVYRILGSKIADATNQTQEVLDEYAKIAGDSVTFVKISDIDADINTSFNDLYRNLSLTVALVFLVLFLFVGIRQAFLAAISIPLVFMTAFVAMSVTGISLNFLSIFSLLLSLGLLVDVTIVIISAITTYYKSGRFTPKETALLVWKDFFTTLLVTTLTTVWAFLPLLLATGIMGEFLKPMPIVVSSVLLGSVFVGFFIILPLMVWMLDLSLPSRVRILFMMIGSVVVISVLNQIFAMFNISLPLLIWIILIPVLFIMLVAVWSIIQRIAEALKKTIQKRFCHTRDIAEHCFQDGLVDISVIENIYTRTLDKALSQKRYRRVIVVMVVIFFFFSVSLVGFGFVKNEFFPKDDMNMLYVSMELPLDTRASISEESARKFVSQIVDIQGLSNIQTQIGAKIGSDGALSLGLNPNNVLITLNLIDKDDRDITSSEIAQLLRKDEAVTSFVDGNVLVVELDGGPPAGADVTIKLLGDDLEQLNKYADTIVDYLNNTNGAINVQKSIESGSMKVVFVPNQSTMRKYGITSQDVGFFLRTFSSGMVINSDVDFDGLSDSRDIMIRLSNEVQSIDALERTVMQTKNGQQVPLTTLGTFVIKESPVQIEREDLKRVVSVIAAVEDGHNANTINNKVGEFVENELNLANGYSWQSGGANEENQKSVNSILQAMVLAGVLIFLTLIIQLNSYRKSFIVLLVIPLAISGVFVLFAVLGVPLSFPALIGVLALFGIVINNSIMIIDQINKNHGENMEFHQAVVDGSSSRLEPILLSSLTTIVGLLPITITQPIWQGLGGAIISGLLFSGMIMLFFIPAVYYMMFEKEYRENK